MCKVLINTAIFTGLFFLQNNTVHAQIKKPGITLGGYAIYASPKGSFKETYNFGGGGEVFGGAGAGKTFVTATVGFLAFKPHSGIHSGTLTYIPSGTLTYIPFKVGVKYFVFKKIVFVNADLGKAVVKYKGFNESRFTRGIGFGAKLPGLEAALYYDGWKNKNKSGFSNSVDVKIGWSISL